MSTSGDGSDGRAPSPWTRPQQGPPTGGWAAPGYPPPSGYQQQPGYQQPSGHGAPGYGPPTAGWGPPATAWAPPSGPAWGPAPGWGPPPAPSRKRRPLRAVLLVLGVLVLVAVVLVLLFGLLVGPRFLRYAVLDPRAVEQGVTRIVGIDWHRGTTDVRCPDDERARANVTFFCTATVDGRPAQIPISVLDDAGTYAVGQPR